MDARILTLGDAAFTVEFPDLTGSEGAKVIAAFRKDIALASIAGIIDLVGASRSLTICIDPLNADLQEIRDQVMRMMPQRPEFSDGQSRRWTLPVCYDRDYAPDLEDVARKAGMTTSEIVTLHSAQVFDVLFIGFLPGFPFMSKLPASLRFPRKKTPRVAVPAGSVAIANDQAAIYPWQSPGGWHLLGRCPVPLFNPERDSPSLLMTGDRVSFQPVPAAEFEHLKSDFAANRLEPSRFAQTKET